MKGGNTYEKITHKAVHCNADIDIYSNNEHSGKGKDQIEQNKDFFTKRENLHLESKRNKEKSKVVKQQENDRYCNKKRKSYSQKQGTAVITAKIGKKKYKCKVKVWQKTTKKPTKTNTESNPIGTRVNPADPRIGITLDTTGGTVYFKLTETLKGQEAENRLLQMNQSLEEIKQGEYEHTGTTLVLFVYDVQAVNGFAAYPLNGLDIINSYTLYDGTCSKNIKNIESFYLSEGYEAMIPTNLNLYTGASSKMYEALWVPDEMTSFSNQLYTRKTYTILG